MKKLKNETHIHKETKIDNFRESTEIVIVTAPKVVVGGGGGGEGDRGQGNKFTLKSVVFLLCILLLTKGCFYCRQNL